MIIKSYEIEKIDFLFLDVDLITSTYDCIKYLWKYIVDESFIFSDDACDIDVVSIWFDQKWWKENFGCKPPGYIGSGCGIPLGGKYSSLGYTIKNPKKDTTDWRGMLEKYIHTQKKRQSCWLNILL